MPIQIRQKNNTQKVRDPYYLLVYNYMIGDANGDTTKDVEISLDNPYLERYVTLMNSLKSLKGTWGIVLEYSYLSKALKQNLISQEDHDFLMQLMFPEDIEDNVVKMDSLLEDNDYKYEFMDGVRSDAEYSFLVFQGVDLFYVDEYGTKHETEIV